MKSLAESQAAPRPPLARSFYSFLRCSVCGGTLNPKNRRHRPDGPLQDGELTCTESDAHVFPIKAFVPDMVPGSLLKAIARLSTAEKAEPSPREVDEAYDWLVATLHLPLNRSNVYLETLCRHIARLLRISYEARLDQKETCELMGILGAKLMSPGYKRHVADQMHASLRAVSYEKYEDILLRKTVETLIHEKGVVLVELGSGVGRLLHQYATCISSDEDAASSYRYQTDSHSPNPLYTHSEPVADNLKLVLGIDFVEGMIRRGRQWLHGDGLDSLVQLGRIVQVLASTHHLNLALDWAPYDSCTKLVCILFQTLGNQVTKELQVEMLRKAKFAASREGLVFVSVFNRQAFEEQGRPYYSSIKGSVGFPVYCEEGVFLSNRAVYSKWFAPADLRELFHEAGLEPCVIADASTLRVFPEYGSYLHLNEQTKYKARAVIGLSSANPNLLRRVESLMISTR